MKKLIAMLLGVSLLLIMSACSSKQTDKQKTNHQTPSSTTMETHDSTTAETEVTTNIITSEKEETTSKPNDEKLETSPEQAEELTKQQKEEEPVNQEQFYITAKSTTFTANFADNGSADAFHDLLREGDLTINMSDYGSFEKVGSIGTSLPRKDTHISTTIGDVVLYQGNQIVISYGTNSWSYSRLGKVEGATAEALLSAFGSGDVAITFSLTKPQ